MRLRKLFEFVGDHFGISVEVVTTDGRQPIGRGIGPVLEAQDVMAVLANDPRAPADLREKSLRLAAHLLEYDPMCVVELVTREPGTCSIAVRPSTRCKRSSTRRDHRSAARNSGR